MGYVDEVQEQMKADMVALKDQMASMMEVMLSMKKLIESNMATAVTAEADPTHPSTTNQAHQPAPDMGGRGGEILGSTGGPRLGYNKNAYPYGLPPPLFHTAHHAREHGSCRSHNLRRLASPTHRGHPRRAIGACPS